MTLATGPNSGILEHGDPGEGHYAELTRTLRALDFFINPWVTSHLTSAPPVTPANGEAYIVGASPTGAWAGKANQIARWTTRLTTPAWEFFVPKKGWALVYSRADDQRYQFDGRVG